MKIAKYGHCCLLIEENGLRILTDPGAYSSGQSEARGVDVVLITHEHADHLHMDSLLEVLKNNPAAKVVTNTAVGKLLSEAGIEFSILEHGQSREFGGILFEGFGDQHAEIYQKLWLVQNTGYFIGNKLFYPGDALTNPGKPVEVLALPVAGPWLRISESIDYAKTLKPKTCFPVHDGMFKNPNTFAAIFEKVLGEAAIKFQILEEAKETEV